MIVSKQITLVETNYLNNLVSDYLKNDLYLKDLITNKPTLEGFQEHLKLKSAFPEVNRKVLVEVLNEQYKTVNCSIATETNIQLIANSTTYTVTTGHQLNLATGPLYVIYKILTVINLAEELKAAFKAFDFVPVFWMATEDHDFEEINHFNIGDEKFSWNTNQTGAVGSFKLDELKPLINTLHKKFKSNVDVDAHIAILEKAYSLKNLSIANRYLINELFGDFGLVILDADSVQLKSFFKKHLVSEILNQNGFKSVTQTNNYLKERYNSLVNPRELNLFYKKEHIRERIVYKNKQYEVLNTEIRFTTDEILSEVDKNPNYFSPNVLMRPLYQEVILPNLAYIGGGGELAYWLQLKQYFDAEKVVFPILLIRNSLLFLDERKSNKLEQLKLDVTDLVQPQQEVIKKIIKKQSLQKIDFSEQKKFLEQQFDKLAELATQTDYSFKGAVDAQRAKQLKGLDKLEKRWLKAELKRNQDYVKRLQDFLESINKNKVPQERIQNYLTLLMSGFTMNHIKATIQPLIPGLTIVTKKNPE